MNDAFRFKIAIQTIKDYKKTTIIIALLFMVMAAMYAGMFPSFQDTLLQLAESGALESYTQVFGPAAMDMATYVGFINLELYQIFWIVILGILLGFIAASQISREIEGKTIDILMSNPVSRKQIVFEKFIGLIPLMLVINFATMFAVMGITIAIGESLNFGYLFLTHLVSIPYFLAVFAIGILISVIVDEKMKASIFFIGTLMGMYVIDMVSKTSADYEAIGYASIIHYVDLYDSLKYGKVDVSGVFVLIAVIVVSLVIAMIYFEHKDIQVT